MSIFSDFSRCFCAHLNPKSSSSRRTCTAHNRFVFSKLHHRYPGQLAFPRHSLTLDLWPWHGLDWFRKDTSLNCSAHLHWITSFLDIPSRLLCALWWYLRSVLRWGNPQTFSHRLRLLHVQSASTFQALRHQSCVKKHQQLSTSRSTCLLCYLDS